MKWFNYISYNKEQKLNYGITVESVPDTKDV